MIRKYIITLNDNEWGFEDLMSYFNSKEIPIEEITDTEDKPEENNTKQKLSVITYETVGECKHNILPVYTSYSSNFQKLECYRCSKCGALFSPNCISLANSAK